MSTLFLFLTSVDPSLGKIDKHSLSQQTLMELLIEGIFNPEILCGSKESPKDISEWMEVYFNDTREIIQIHWYSSSLEGSIELKWLPLSSLEVFFSFNSLIGTVDLTCLPGCLQYLSLSGNQFDGTIDLTQLPSSLTALYLDQNGFCGVTDFSQLPKSLNTLDVERTQLEGDVCDFEGSLMIRRSKVTDKRKQ